MKIGVIGKGGQAREIADYCREIGADISFYALDPEYINRNSDNEVDINAPTDEQKKTPVVISNGAPGVKRDLANRWQGTEFAKIVSSQSYIARTAMIEVGCVVSPFGAIGANSSLGRHVYVNVGASIPHDCTIGDYCSISPGARLGGHVVLGDGCFIGINSTIKNGVTLADGCVVGAGAVVINDVEEPNSVLVGVPAKVINRNKEWLREI